MCVNAAEKVSKTKEKTVDLTAKEYIILSHYFERYCSAFLHRVFTSNDYLKRYPIIAMRDPERGNLKYSRLIMEFK